MLQRKTLEQNKDNQKQVKAIFEDRSPRYTVMQELVVFQKIVSKSKFGSGIGYLVRDSWGIIDSWDSTLLQRFTVGCEDDLPVIFE